VNKATREQRKSMRETVNGQLVATHLPPERHGSARVYDKWFCRCTPCTAANSVYQRELRERKGTPSRDELDAALAERRAALIEEYQFMRSFGMNHERACKTIGLHPETETARAARDAA